MYDEFINKMTFHFSERGSILFSKSCDFAKKYPISKEDMMMYYEILCSKETIPENISRENHKMCCLYYLSKDIQEYQDIFLDQYVQTIDANNLEIKPEYLYRIFNIIEFDKTYLDSPRDNQDFLYQLLKKFANFETDFHCYIMYKYYRGYLKYKLGDLKQFEKEYLEIVTELADNQDFLFKYILFVNELLNIKRFQIYGDENDNKASMNEYIQILQKLLNDVKGINQMLALKIGFDLFTAYIKIKDYKKGFSLLNEMKNILKKTLLKGSTLKNGIYFYLAIACRLGYIGIILDDKKTILNAIEKIKKTMLYIDNNDKNLIQLKISYTFIQAILELGLYNKTDFNIEELATNFQKEFLPELRSNTYSNSIVTKNNKETIIVDFLMINNKNPEYYNCTKSILEECYKKLKTNNNNSSTFMLYLAIIHEKIYRKSESYITELSNRKKSEYKKEIEKYFKYISEIINNYIDDEPFLKTALAKSMIINIYFDYGSILLREKELEGLKKIINEIIDVDENKKIINLRKKLNINRTIPSYGLWLKLLGDYYLILKQYNAAIDRYKTALETLEKIHPLIPLISFNCGTAYFFEGKKIECINYLNKCINEYNQLLMNNTSSSFSHFDINPDEINKKKALAQKLLDELSK